MRKSLTGAIIGLLLLPQVSFAQADAVGIEFLSPLVQTIITLLHDRIAELSAEVVLLRGSSVTAPTCPTLGASIDSRDDVERSIRAKYAGLIADVDLKIAEQQEIKNRVIEERNKLGTGITPIREGQINAIINTADVELAKLATKKLKLNAELSKELASVGVY